MGLLRRRERDRPIEELVQITDEDRRYLTRLHAESAPRPDGAPEDLSAESPRLRELQDAYAALDIPATDSSRWAREAVEGFLDLRWFRGRALITWHYRELPRITRLKYWAFLRYVAERDPGGLLGRLGEDGAFG